MGRMRMEGAVEERKRRARKHWAGLRDSLNPLDRARVDAAIANRVCAHPAYRAAGVVFAYVSVGAEVDTRELIRHAWAAGKDVAVPRCIPRSRAMAWHRLDGFDELRMSPHGVPEPPDDPTRIIDPRSAGAVGVAIVPGHSFDDEGFRLGYGGGFYDVFLAEFPGTSIGLCRHAQLSPRPLPRDSFDVPVQILITERGCRAW